MASFKTRFASLIVAGSLMLTGLAGCAQGGAAAEPTSTKEVLERYVANPNKDNYHMDMDMTIGLSMLGSNLDMPMKGSFDVADGSAHGTLTADMSALLGTSYDTELYVEKNGDTFTQYTSDKTTGETKWTSSVLSDGFFASNVTSDSLLEEAEFSKADGDAGYKLTIPGDKLVGALSEMGGDAGQVLNSESNKEIMDALGKSNVDFMFDKDCLLKSIGMDFDYDMSQTSGSTTVQASMAIDLAMNFSNYGKVDAASIAVPANVKSAAVSTTTSTTTTAQ